MWILLPLSRVFAYNLILERPNPYVGKLHQNFESVWMEILISKKYSICIYCPKNLGPKPERHHWEAPIFYPIVKCSWKGQTVLNLQLTAVFATSERGLSDLLYIQFRSLILKTTWHCLYFYDFYCFMARDGSSGDTKAGGKANITTFPLATALHCQT